MSTRRLASPLALAGSLLSFAPVWGARLRRGDAAHRDDRERHPTTTDLPNNGFEGMRFLGYPIFEGLVLWVLTRADRPAGLRPGLAESWEQAPDDRKKSVFHLRKTRCQVVVIPAGMAGCFETTRIRSACRFTPKLRRMELSWLRSVEISMRLT